MAELFPCPNPRCFHWNPAGRKKCYACQEDLSGTEGLADAGAGRGLTWLIVAAVVVGGGLLAWVMFRPSGEHGTKTAASSTEDGGTEGPLEIATLNVQEGSYAAYSPFAVTGKASKPIASVTLNGNPGLVEGATSFSGEVALVEGANQVEVVVTDASNATTSKTVTVYHHPWALPDGLSFAGVNFRGFETYKSSKDEALLVLVPDGSFQMGSERGDADEKPVHQVTVSAYFIDAMPVTNAQYAKFVAAAGRPAPPAPDYDATYFETKLDHPVVNVSYDDAKAYAEWAGRRLPTEAEWERAARGPVAGAYPWGDEVPSETSGHCNLKGEGDGFAQTSPVGHFTKGASAYGILDAAGNVWQWTGDWYAPGFYVVSDEQDPTGPEAGSQRVLRGGAFTSGPDDVRSTNRYPRSPKDRPSNVGFRTAVAFASEAPTP